MLQQLNATYQQGISQESNPHFFNQAIHCRQTILLGKMEISDFPSPFT
jgi:hypothetical protein